MAFWGTEVKPGRPFTHAPLNGNRRLRLSGATLGMGSATQKSIVQCNVGNKGPVFMCCLFPEKAEFCSLNLEFEESDEVVFSVIGPRTVHLTGYYLSTSSRSLNDESESYGEESEDIGETDTERSKNSQESEYGGSFINDDDDLEVFLSSPPPGSNEEMLDLKKSKDAKGRRGRLTKTYQLSESENDDTSQQKYFTRAVTAVQVLDTETEDTLPISSLSKAKHASNSGKADVEDKAKKETVDLNYNEAEFNATTLEGTNATIGAQPERESGVRNEEKSKTEKGNLNNKEVDDDATMLEGTNAAIGAQPKCESGIRNEEKPKHVLGVDSALMPNNKTEELAKVERFPEGGCGMIGEVVLEQNELASKEECKHNGLLLAASQVCLEDGAKLKRKRQKHVKKKTLEDNVPNEDERWKSCLNLDSATQDVHLEDKGTQKQVNDKKRKKKKRCKSKDDGDAMKMEPPVLSANQREGSVVEMEGKNANDSATQLSNGIIIEELEMGKPDGKVASLGKKVHVHYIVKLKESGQVFDSTAGKPLSKFRLGEEKVPELWNVGLDGMRVGGKRRLIVPPSMSYRNEGAGEDIPSNSWLVFDVELVKVR